MQTVLDSIKPFVLSLRLTLLLVMLVAILLRWDVYPKTYFADELIPRAVVRHMQVTNTLDTNWENADWHGDYAGGFYKLRQYNFSSYHTMLLGFRELANVAGLKNLPDLVLYRVLSVACQLGCLLLVFAIAARLSGYLGGLLAAVFMAVMPQAVVDAHYARPESFVMLLVALACWLALRGHADRNWRYLLPEAVVWGVAFACKFSFLPMILLACAFQMYTFRNAWLFLAWCASFAAGIAVSAPYILLDFSGFLHGVGLLLNQYSPVPHDATGINLYFPSAEEMIFYMLSFFSLPILLVMTISFLTRNVASLFFVYSVSVVSVFYLLLFARQGVFFERNLSHLLPLWSVVFSLGFLAFIKLANIKKSYVYLQILLATIAWPLYLSIEIDRHMFIGLEDSRQDVLSFEEGLMKLHSAGKITPLPIMGNINLKLIGGNELLRVPQLKVTGMALVGKGITDAGFRLVALKELPLSYLPYNQLQINQLPPAYAYYMRTPVVADGARL